MRALEQDALPRGSTERWDSCPAYAGARRTWTVSRETPGRMLCGHAPRRFVVPMHVMRNDLLPRVSCSVVSVEDPHGA